MGRFDNKAKHAKSKQIPDPEKAPRWAYDPALDWRKQPVLWSFAIFDDYDWRDADRNADWCVLVESLTQLKACEGRTWAEIESNRWRDHPVEVSALIADARKRLADVFPDADELWRLRLSGTMRVWGIRERRIFRVLWWDPHHVVCPSELKHT